MNIKNIINEVLNEVLNDIIWYHGTPDVRDFNKIGNFTQRYGKIEYVSNPEKWQETQNQMKIARKNGNEDLYFDLLDKVSDYMSELKYKKPIFFTNKESVARTYTDASRSFDYQNAESAMIKAHIRSNKLLNIHAFGERFRNLDANIVKRAFINAGISEDEINKYYNMFPMYIRNDKMTAETIGIIAQLLGFDTVDIIGVLDSYHGGTIKSTVRMVFDPTQIQIIS